MCCNLEDSLESVGAFKPEHLGYITCICEDTSDSIFHIWEIHKYKEVTEFIKKLVCVTWISYHQRRSPPMSHFYKRLCMNTAILLIQIGKNLLQARISLKTNLHFWRHKLWPFSSRSTRLWRKLTSRDTAVELLVALKEDHLSSQMWLVKSVARRDISKILQVKGKWI